MLQVASLDLAPVCQLENIRAFPFHQEGSLVSSGHVGSERRKYALSPAETQTRRRCYSMKNPLILPEFNNEDEERDFWDKIDISEYFELSDFMQVVFPNLKPTKRLISIRLPDDLIAEVKQKAKKQDVPYQQLIRQYIRQGLGAK